MKNTSLLLILTFNCSGQNLILDGNTIPMNSNNNASINSTTGDIIVTSADGNLTCTSNSVAPTITSLSSNPSVLPTGSNSTISWVLSGGATSCTKTGDWSGVISGSNVTDGTHNELISNIVNNSTYSLECSNNIGSSGVVSTSITIGTMADCSASQPILAGNEDTIPQDFNDISSGNGFPGQFGSTYGFGVDRNKYVALSFVSSTIVNKAKTVFNTPGTGQGGIPTGITIAFSECPGDFATHLNQVACLVSNASTPSILWSIDPNQTAANVCKMNPNKTYYLNIVHSESPPDYQISKCSSTSCGVLLSSVPL